MAFVSPPSTPTPAAFEYTRESPFANGLFVIVINALAVAEPVISVATLNVISGAVASFLYTPRKR